MADISWTEYCQKYQILESKDEFTKQLIEKISYSEFIREFDEMFKNNSDPEYIIETLSFIPLSFINKKTAILKHFNM